MGLGAVLEGDLYRCRADAARWGVDDTEEGDVILRVDEAGDGGEDILDFAAVEKAFSADESIGDFHAAEVFLQKARLGVHAVDHREVFPRDTACIADGSSLADDKLGFCFVIGHCHDMDRIAAGDRTPEVLHAAARVVFDEAVCRGENGIRAAVVLLEADDLGIWEMLFKLEDVRHLGPTPPVDALVVIAHHADIRRVTGRKQAH